MHSTSKVHFAELQHTGRNSRSCEAVVYLGAAKFSGEHFMAMGSNRWQPNAASLNSLQYEWTEVILAPDVRVSIDNNAKSILAADATFSIAHFGASYSPLCDQKCIPVAQPNLDQLLVRNAFTRPNDGVIARAVMDLGINLSATLMAESVKTLEQVDCIDAIQCDAFQGCLYIYTMHIQ